PGRHMANTGTFDIAQYCLKGHLITGEAFTHPEKRSDYCETCGSKTVENCPNCNAQIRGYYIPPETSFYVDMRPNRRVRAGPYCHACGKPYPWTTYALRQARRALEAAPELTPSERRELLHDIREVSTKGPAGKGAAQRAAELVKKVGP